MIAKDPVAEAAEILRDHENGGVPDPATGSQKLRCCLAAPVVVCRPGLVCQLARLPATARRSMSHGRNRDRR